MIQKIFLDTNVLIDLFLQREPFAGQTEEIFDLRDRYEFEIFISSLSVANIAYTLDKVKKRPHEVIGKILQLVKILDLNDEIIHETVVSKFDDFEDGLQYFSAVTVDGIDVIVTRDKKGFKPSIIPVVTPKEFLDAFVI